MLSNMQSKYHYDKEVDDLIISNKGSDEIVEKNFMFDNFVISVTKDGKIVGLEIMNLSNVLREYGLDLNILESFQSVELEIVPKEDFVLISVSFDVEEEGCIVERKIAVTHLPIQFAHN